MLICGAIRQLCLSHCLSSRLLGRFFWGVASIHIELSAVWYGGRGLAIPCVVCVVCYFGRSLGCLFDSSVRFLSALVVIDPLICWHV